MDALGLAEGERVRVSSRRGSVEAPVHLDEALRAGLAFMTLHFPEQVQTNILTLDAWDPKSGTAEFKATAIRVDAMTMLGEMLKDRPSPDGMPQKTVPIGN